MHGFNLILEGVRQIRGTSTSQVDGADVSLVTSGEGVPTSRDPLHREDRVIRNRPGCCPTSTSRRRPSSGRAPRAASCSCRRARRAALRRMPPRPMCPVCRSIEVRWEPTSGRGRVWSFIVPHPPLLPAFSELAPYNAIIVELEEDPLIRFVGNLVASADGEINEIDPATIEIGEPVRVVFHQIDDVRSPAGSGSSHQVPMTSVARDGTSPNVPSAASRVLIMHRRRPSTVDGGSRPE